MAETNDVIPLFGQPVAGEVCPQMVEMLEDLLEKAKRGEVKAFAYAFVAPNGFVHSARHWDNNIFALIGAVTLLQRNLLTDVEN